MCSVFLKHQLSRTFIKEFYWFIFITATNDNILNSIKFHKHYWRLVSIFYNYLFFFKSVVIIEKSNSANIMKFSKIMKSYIGSSNSSLHNVSNFLDS